MLARIGICNQCGKCCLREGGIISDNPCIEIDEDRCKFYTENLNNKLYGHCLIYGKTGTIKKVKDRFGTQITQVQIDWFNQNCIDFPLAKDAESGHYPPPECSFSFEVIADG